MSFFIFKKPLNVWNWLATQNNSLESNNSDKSIKIVTCLYCYEGWIDEDSLISKAFRKIYGEQIFRLTCCWYWTTIALHHCIENQKNHQNSIEFLGPDMLLVRKRNITFFKNGTVFPYGSFLAKDEGTNGQTKGTKFTRPLSLWESKMKKNNQNLTFCQGKTNARRELNL